MIFAPVVIPTLNRYSHFRKCLESLELCHNADNTDVYVALDFPPSDKYVEGWKEIDTYLQEKEKKNGFKRLTVYRRETNYFFSGKGNALSVFKEIRPYYDRYIFSEDDNVFSPGFLDFINLGLEQFKDDKNVLALCGYSLFVNSGNLPLKKYNTFKNKSYFSAWGYGSWFEKMFGLNNLDYCRDAFNDKEAMRRVRSLPDSFRYMMMTLKAGRKFPQTDVMCTLYQRIYDMYTITPIVSLVDNVGYDGSGVHKIVGRDSSLYEGIKTNNDSFTDFILAPDNISDDISQSIIKRFSYKGEVKLWMHILCLFIRIVGYDRYLKMNQLLRKILKNESRSFSWWLWFSHK